MKKIISILLACSSLFLEGWGAAREGEEEGEKKRKRVQFLIRMDKPKPILKKSKPEETRLLEEGELPEEVWCRILEYSSPDVLGTLSCVSHRFLRLSRDPNLWKTLSIVQDKGPRILDQLFWARACEAIDISGSVNTKKDMENLTGTLSCCVQLRTLTLGDNDFTRGVSGIFGEWLSTNASLTALTIRDSKIKTRGFRRIGEGVHSHPALASLKIEECHLDDEGVEALGIALQGNTILTDLSFARNTIGPRGSAFLGRGLLSVVFPFPIF